MRVCLLLCLALAWGCEAAPSSAPPLGSSPTDGGARPDVVQPEDARGDGELGSPLRSDGGAGAGSGDAGRGLDSGQLETDVGSPWRPRPRQDAGPVADADVGPGVDVDADAGPALPVDAGWQGPSPLSPRLENQSCRLPREALPTRMTTEEAFGRLNFSRPLWLGHAPGDGQHLYVLEQGGEIHRFEDRSDVAASEEFLRLSVSRAGNEEGLLGMAFHPDYAQNGRLFVYTSAASPRRSVVSEFRRDPANPGRALVNSERVLLEVSQPFSNHNGGDLRFGPDGYLYITLGDGGSSGDPRNNGQRPSTLLGSMLRIDVDQGEPYAIPPDNPFAQGGRVPGDRADARPEVWAWGLRNVWRFSFDRDSGELWAGDVGQGAWEEVGRLQAGANHGWNVREGFACYRGNACESEGMVEPDWVYGRHLGRSVTGGFVYRGPRFPELVGAYIFADYHSGRIWALRLGVDAEQQVVELANTPYSISSFGEAEDGRLYFTAFTRGRSLHWLVRAPEGGVAEPFPERLSETGCFADTALLQPAAGVVPYDVRVPFWSDGALKRRWLALPEGGQINFGEPGAWGFPEGTVLIKHFELEVGGWGPRRRVETRLLVKRSSRWQGYSYRWNQAQTDATLLPSGLTEHIETETGGQLWEYPSRSGCDDCHTEAAGYVLGWRTRQLNRIVRYDQRPYPQLLALAEAGYLSLPEEGVDQLPVLPLMDDESAPLEARARAVLDVNCAMCHQPEAPGNATLDLRSWVSLEATNSCGVEPSQGDLGLAGASLLAPGEPERSVLLQRMVRRDEDGMPPLSSRLVDQPAADLIGRWISSMDACP